MKKANTNINININCDIELPEHYHASSANKAIMKLRGREGGGCYLTNELPKDKKTIRRAGFLSLEIVEIEGSATMEIAETHNNYSDRSYLLENVPQGMDSKQIFEMLRLWEDDIGEVTALEKCGSYECRITRRGKNIDILV